MHATPNQHQLTLPSSPVGKSSDLHLEYSSSNPTRGTFLHTYYPSAYTQPCFGQFFYLVCRYLEKKNGPSFTSQEFKVFLKANGIHHVTSAPYHPSTNAYGLAEGAVQTVKQGIKRTQGSTIQERLSRFLFDYRITPHPTTGVAPSELLINRRLRSRLDLLHPQIRELRNNKPNRRATTMVVHQ